jgi:hypothetical protein
MWLARDDLSDRAAAGQRTLVVSGLDALASRGEADTLASDDAGTAGQSRAHSDASSGGSAGEDGWNGSLGALRAVSRLSADRAATFSPGLAAKVGVGVAAGLRPGFGLGASAHAAALRQEPAVPLRIGLPAATTAGGSGLAAGGRPSSVGAASVPAGASAHTGSTRSGVVSLSDWSVLPQPSPAALGMALYDQTFGSNTPSVWRAPGASGNSIGSGSTVFFPPGPYAAAGSTGSGAAYYAPTAPGGGADRASTTGQHAGGVKSMVVQGDAVDGMTWAAAAASAVGAASLAAAAAGAPLAALAGLARGPLSGDNSLERRNAAAAVVVGSAVPWHG